MDMPSRTLLYDLEPFGVGTPWVESLSSYIVRLAAAHWTPISRLLYAVAVNGNIPVTRFQAAALNGVGASAALCVEALGRATGRDDLVWMTCVPMASVVDRCGLPASHVRWCPNCLQQWGPERAYTPLLWSLRVVPACVVHGTVLLDRCPACHSRFQPFAAGARPGYCSRCQTWLGTTAVTDEAPVAAIQSARLVGDLLAALPRYDGVIPRFQDNVATLYNHWKARRWLPGTTAVRTLYWEWQRSKSPVALRSAVKVARIADMSLTTLFFEDVPVGLLASDAALPSGRRAAKAAVTNRCDIETVKRQETRLALEALICTDNFDTLWTLPEIATRVGCSSSYLHKHFPGLGSRIRTAYEERVRSRLVTALASEAADEPSSLARLLFREGISRATALRVAPSLCRSLQQKYVATHHKGAVDKAPLGLERRRGRRPANWRRVQPLVDEVLSRHDFTRALSCMELARRIGCSYDYLHDNVPGLADGLRNKYETSVRDRIVSALGAHRGEPIALGELLHECQVTRTMARKVAPDVCAMVDRPSRHDRSDGTLAGVPGKTPNRVEPTAESQEARKLRIAAQIDGIIGCYNFRHRLTLTQLSRMVGRCPEYLSTTFPGLARELRSRYDTAVCAALAGELAAGNLTLSLAELFDRYEVSRTSVRRMDPQSYRAIKESIGRQRERERNEELEHTRAQIAGLLTKTPPPGLRALARECGRSRNFLWRHFPDLCEQCQRLQQKYRRAQRPSAHGGTDVGCL
jgi:AraC-like DNA-binding protein